MSSPSDINVEAIGSSAKEQKSLTSKAPSRYNLESQLFQDTYEVEYSSKNVQSSVEDWIDVPSADFQEGPSGKFASLDSTSGKHVPHRSLSAYGSFYQGGSNYSIGSQLTDTSSVSGVSQNPHNLHVNIPLGSNSNSFHLPNHQQFTPSSVGTSMSSQQFSPSVFRTRLGPSMEQQPQQPPQAQTQRYRTSNGQFVEVPSAPSSLGLGSHGGGFFSSHENSFNSMSGYLNHNAGQTDIFNDDVPPDTLIFVVRSVNIIQYSLLLLLHFGLRWHSRLPAEITSLVCESPRL